MEPFVGVIWPVQRARITMPFKAYDTPWYTPTDPHRGVDTAPYPGSIGAPVRSPLAGRVVHVGDHRFAGKVLITKHAVPFEFWAGDLHGVVHTHPAEAPFYIRTTHHSRIKVGEDDVVRTGQDVALIGNSGEYTTGPHVHMELWLNEYEGKGILVNPVDFFIASVVGLRLSMEVEGK